MVDEDEAKAVGMVMVIKVIMKLAVVIEMMLNKEFDVEVDKEVAKEVFMVIMCENISCWKQNWVQFNKKLAGISFYNPVVAMRHLFCPHTTSSKLTKLFVRNSIIKSESVHLLCQLF